jgi:hypothetical protein
MKINAKVAVDNEEVPVMIWTLFLHPKNIYIYCFSHNSPLADGRRIFSQGWKGGENRHYKITIKIDLKKEIFFKIQFLLHLFLLIFKKAIRP